MPTIENIPVWTVRPNWSTEVISRYAWKTSVVESPTQVEQRRSLRIGPRITLSIGYTTFAAERTFFDLALAARISSDWYIPLPYEIGRLSAPLSLGATSIPFTRAYREYNAPGFVLLTDNTFENYEVVSVNSADLSALAVTATGSAWPAGTKVYPLRKGRLTGAPRVSRRGPSAAVAQVDFLLTENLEWPGRAALPAYLGFPVWGFRPDESEAMDFAWSRNAFEMDNDTGIPVLLDLTGLGYTTQSFRWFLHGRRKHADFLDLLHVLKGRLTPFWVSTYSEDLTIVAAVADGASAFTAVSTGYVRLGGPMEGKNHVEIRLKARLLAERTARWNTEWGFGWGGETGEIVFHREVISCDADFPGVETFTLSAPLAFGFEPADVLRVSFLRLARLDQDEIEIVHSSDTEGVARAATAIRSLRE